MKILHIANSYGGTDVYTRLFTELDRAGGCRQQIFVPLNARNHDRLGRKTIDFREAGSALHYSTKLRSWHRYLYGRKIAAATAAAEAAFDVSDVDLIHAHTAFFDGAVARELSKRYGKPYLTAVRNTDVSGYYERFWWRRGYFGRILADAAAIVFISPKYRDLFYGAGIAGRLREGLEAKTRVCPNGISDAYLQNRHRHAAEPGHPARVVYAGGFFERKGLREVVLAADRLRAEGREIEVEAIGRGLPGRPKDARYLAELDALAAERPWLTLREHTDAAGLIEAYRRADLFAMPSANETFGLVYAEALSQGLPIVYAKGEGFDGFYADGAVGAGAKAKDAGETAEAIRRILDDYAGYAERVGALELERDFSWRNIARNYLGLYGDILKGKAE